MRTETIGDATLYLGDCADVLPSLGLASTRGVDAVITDPPYAIPTIVAAGRDTTRSVGDLSVVETAFRVYFDQWADVLSDKGRVFVFCDGTSYPVVFRASFGRFSSALLVWDKGQIGMGREFRKSHELILHAWRKDTPIFADGVGRADVLKFAPVSSNAREHQAQKPTDLVCELVRPSGKVILDPFMGSGTTGVSALKLGRKFIGIEIEPRFFDAACRRIEAEWRRSRLFEEPKRKPEQAAMVFADDCPNQAVAPGHNGGSEQ